MTAPYRGVFENRKQQFVVPFVLSRRDSTTVHCAGGAFFLDDRRESPGCQGKEFARFGLWGWIPGRSG